MAQRWAATAFEDEKQRRRKAAQAAILRNLLGASEIGRDAADDLQKQRARDERLRLRGEAADRDRERLDIAQQGSTRADAGLELRQGAFGLRETGATQARGDFERRRGETDAGPLFLELGSLGENDPGVDAVFGRIQELAPHLSDEEIWARSKQAAAAAAGKGSEAQRKLDLAGLRAENIEARTSLAKERAKTARARRARKAAAKAGPSRDVKKAQIREAEDLSATGRRQIQELARTNKEIRKLKAKAASDIAGLSDEEAEQLDLLERYVDALKEGTKSPEQIQAEFQSRLDAIEGGVRAPLEVDPGMLHPLEPIREAPPVPPGVPPGMEPPPPPPPAPPPPAKEPGFWGRLFGGGRKPTAPTTTGPEPAPAPAAAPPGDPLAAFRAMAKPQQRAIIARARAAMAANPGLSEEAALVAAMVGR